MICILYVVAISTLLGVAGLLVERALPDGWPRRWVWCAVIAISMTIPPIYQAKHTVTVADVLERAERPALGHALGAALPNVFDAGWWAQARAYDSAINRFWLIGSGLLILWGLANVWRVSRVVRLSRRDLGKPTIVDGVPVVVTDSMGPATAGLWRTRVLLPRWVLALPGLQRQYVVQHEDEHRRANDARLLFFASLTLILLPWNIALWWQLRRLHLAIEIDCDNRVVAKLGNAHAYGELLLKVAQASSRGPRLQPALLGGMGTLERRLTALLAPTRLRQVLRFLLPAVAIGLLYVVLTMPHPMLGSGHSAQTAEAVVPHQ